MKILIPKGFQYWLAHQLGISQARMSMVFSGRRPVSKDIAEKLVKLFPDTDKFFWQLFPIAACSWIFGEELYNKTKTNHWKRQPKKGKEKKDGKPIKTRNKN